MTVRPTIKTELFEGPLELLLFLISKNKVSILDIPISVIFEQYSEYLEKLRGENIEIASDFLHMAARLVYIKTAMLLPKSDEGEQLRSELAAELMEYQVCRMAAQKLMESSGFDRFVREPAEIEFDKLYTRIHEAYILAASLINAEGKKNSKKQPQKSDFDAYVAKPVISVAWGVYTVLKKLKTVKTAGFEEIFFSCRKKDQLVAVFMAALELMKAGRISLDEKYKFTLLRNENKEG